MPLASWEQPCVRLGAETVAIRLGGADWDARIRAAALRDVTVFHLAARAYASSRRDAEGLMRDNVEKTRVLASAALAGGPPRSVLPSTIKVNGEETFDRPYSASDPPQPQDDYGRSK